MKGPFPFVAAADINASCPGIFRHFLSAASGVNGRFISDDCCVGTQLRHLVVVLEKAIFKFLISCLTALPIFLRLPGLVKVGNFFPTFLSSTLAKFLPSLCFFSPRVWNWIQAATRNQSVIREWWSKWPDANVGIKTGVEIARRANLGSTRR